MQYCVVTAYVFCFVYYTLGYDRKHKRDSNWCKSEKTFSTEILIGFKMKKLLCGNKENTYLLGIGIHLFLIYYL